jgi:sulfatase modifying factor 1
MVVIQDEEGFLTKVGNYGISKTEITYWQWGLFCEATGNKQWFRSPYYGVFGDRPAVLVYWDAAIEYCIWMNSKHSNSNSITRGETIGDSDESIEINSPSRRKVMHYKIDIEKKGFRLPTEREWEYAAKGGINHDKYNFCGSNTVDSMAWYKDNADYVAQPVATNLPNSLGIYDMCGNALEWCLEWRFPYNTDRETINAYYPSRGRICRGGGCGFAPRACQVHSRNAVLAYLTEPELGFRVVKK